MSYLIENRHLGVKRCKHGIFAYNRNDAFIGKSLDQYGEWCEFEIDLLRNFIRPGDRVIDVGANIGTHTVAFANLVGPTGKVMAFEPQPELFSLLMTNVTLNCLTNVRCEQTAIVDDPRSLMIDIDALPPPDVMFNFGAMPLMGDSPQKHRAQALTLDARRLTPGPALIKIDVEGMEDRVISGGLDLIKTHTPTLYVENNGLDSRKIHALLTEIGYRGLWSIGPYFSKTNFFGNMSNLWPSVMPSVNLLCLPEETSSRIQLPALMGPDDNWQKVLDRSPTLRRFL
jgi:FkbM family methyltransferase